MDGNLDTCLDVNENRTSTVLGKMTLFKDADDTTKIFDVSYRTNVNCRTVNMLYYRKMAPECSHLMRAALQTESTYTGSSCRYKILCDPGNVTCDLELMIVDKSVEFSLCEIEF